MSYLVLLNLHISPQFFIMYLLATVQEAGWVSPEARSAKGAVPLSHHERKTEGGEFSLG